MLSSLGTDARVAEIIARICCNNGHLPQGAPSSPVLSNMHCFRLDKNLRAIAKEVRCIYTRYADDITFSFIVRTRRSLPAAICTADDEGHLALGAELLDLITNKHHFAINEAKTRLSDRHRRMEVTGLTINKFPNVRRKFIDRIRGALNAWERNGYAKTQKGWQDRIAASANLPVDQKPWKRQYRSGGVAELKNVIWGKLLYLRMVRGKDDLIYTRLAERYNAQVAKEQAAGSFTASVLPVEPVVRDKATVLDACFVIEWSGDFNDATIGADMIGGQGTAFVYRELNLLVTCSHVFEWTGKIGKIDVETDVDHGPVSIMALELVQPGTKKSWPAKILFRDKQMDFALVAFENPPAHRYFSAMDNPIAPGAHGYLIGYPDWKQWTPPDINALTVLNRTMPHHGMNSFTITGAGSIRPGNSGGPFTDDRFRVAGMAQRGAYMGSGHDENLCLEIINALIDQYKATLAPTVPPPLAVVGAVAPAPPPAATPAVAPPLPPAPIPAAPIPTAPSGPLPPPPQVDP
jgi:S1-C subfamily serine protease